MENNYHNIPSCRLWNDHLKLRCVYEDILNANLS